MRFAERVDRLSGDGPAAWAIHSEAVRARARGEDVIVMSVGDPDFATPDRVTEAGVRALRQGDTHYTEIKGRPALRSAIAAETMRNGGPQVTADNVIVMAGAQNALFAAAMCLFSPGDEVIALDPMYVTYEATVAAAGAKLVRVPARADGTFRPDLAALEAAVTPRSRAILIATPNNPSGVALDQAEIEAIAEVARRHDLWVVSDEVYAELIFDGGHRSIAALPGMAGRTATVSSLSKSQAMTGWRAGWLVGPTELVSHVENLSLCMLYGSPGFVQEAAVMALTEARDEMGRMREIYRRRRDLVLEGLTGVPGIRTVAPQAGMFLLLDVRETGMSALDFAWALYRETGVSVLDGAAFGTSTSGHVRLSYTLGEDRLREGCARIRSFAESLGHNAATRTAGA
ncbi:pyridoxal phosphate-dependent aminotransferase [Lutibaculum baratangense]|uniref:Aminotransferase n=1 Tax=Lutibaculum baratangense AMV1 TaxID=631454 RepID=V4RK93_9HYPH|nr:aminotransferase class I/II-fold pyridoxal phosphate-dependent enzyme [Lutibaculum baratangense]ESR25749.1 Aspartate aminotransferase [Lutibaculum baratangense AMV1]